jgi:DNA-binding NarL/FixJ family response regulator
MGEARVSEAGTARGRREERDREIQKLAARGESIATIARQMACSRATVSRALGRMRRSG